MVEWLTTKQFANLLLVKPNSVLRAHCVDGHYCGIKPVKLPNKKLRWPADQTQKLLER